MLCVCIMAKNSFRSDSDNKTVVNRNLTNLNIYIKYFVVKIHLKDFLCPLKWPRFYDHVLGV